MQREKAEAVECTATVIEILVNTGNILISFFSFVCFGISTLLTVGWTRDILFYRRNFWDFTKDSGINNFEYGFEAGGRKVSNRTRVLVIFPIAILWFLIFGFISAGGSNG
jgi:hypothetical protein